MKIGWVGLGKLGLPCALVMAKAGHEVVGTDVNSAVETYIDSGEIPYEERGVTEAFADGYTIGWRSSVREVVETSDVVFLAVQTPHAPQFEGCTRLTGETRDFDNGFLVQAFRDTLTAVNKPTTLVVVSTVLPGTFDRELRPLLTNNPLARVLYSPAFIAMGTTMDDFSKPEMVIVGGDVNEEVRRQFEELHRTIHESPILWMRPIECELVKMSYNTFIGMKIVFANALGELCEKIGGDVDVVTGALSHARQRIISSKYLSAGMGDGGGCHPRDQLALSWLAKQTDLSTNIFEYLMQAREDQTGWQARVCREAADVTGLPIRLCGREYKAESNLVVGSPSRLLMDLLTEQAEWQDDPPTEPAIYFIGVNHSRYRDWIWPKGSIVVDPWGLIDDQVGVVVRRLGRRSTGSGS